MALFNFYIYVLEPTLRFFYTAQNSWVTTNSILKLALYIFMRGYAEARLVEAPRYKSEVRRFDSQWCHGNFLLNNPSGRTMVLGSTQPQTEMSTRNISSGVKAYVRLTTFMCRLSGNLGASTSWNPLGLSRPVTRLLYICCFTFISLGPVFSSSATNSK
jgi:hypothetical protein